MRDAEELELPDRVAMPAEADERFDHLAALTRRILDAPTALVAMVDRTRQTFPGSVGLPEPWQTRRETPLSHSFCQYVVAAGRPLIVTDARKDPRLFDNAAIADLGVIAYVGIPLRDDEDRVVGSLCAIDSRPRVWTDLEIRNLIDLAEACESEVKLRAVATKAAVLAERERIARGLHGEVFTDLMSLSMLLDNARFETPAQLPTRIGEASTCVERIMSSLGQAVFADEDAPVD